MKIRTDNLEGKPLRWAVAMACGRPGTAQMLILLPDTCAYKPDEDWACGGPIIEREGITLLARDIDNKQDYWATLERYNGENTDERTGYDGPTALIAAMRTFVGEKLGGYINIPNKLVKTA